MTWLVNLRGTRFSSDDMTIAELGEVERVSGVPWSAANPFRQVAVARGFAAVALLRAGISEDQITETLEGLTLADLKGAFEYIPDEPIPDNGGGAVPLPRAAPTTRGSSSGGPRGGGHRKKSAAPA